MDLGKIGVWTTYRHIGEENAAEAAGLVEDLGYGAFWLGGSPRLPSVQPLLEATDRLLVGTSIVNIWGDEPERLATEYTALARDFADRLMVGIGIGHPEATADYSRPLGSMAAFLDRIDRADQPIPRERRCLAALGPNMLELAATRTAGAIPYFVPLEHTRAARERIGPEPLLAPELACVLDDDPERARVTATKYASLYLSLTNYVKNLRSFGFDDEDFANGGSQRLLDSVVPQGTPREIAALAQAHLDAGADHVALQPLGTKGIPAEDWRALADAIR
jgi:probable F420-dependent oxidoreductase